MKLVELKTDSGSIWVNPMAVAFVEGGGQGSTIYFAALAEPDSVLSRRVPLSPAQVVEQLNSGLYGR